LPFRAKTAKGADGVSRVESITVACEANPITATVFIDASYDGDVMVAAGDIDFTAGREANTTYVKAIITSCSTVAHAHFHRLHLHTYRVYICSCVAVFDRRSVCQTLDLHRCDVPVSKTTTLCFQHVQCFPDRANLSSGLDHLNAFFFLQGAFGCISCKVCSTGDENIQSIFLSHVSSPTRLFSFFILNDALLGTMKHSLGREHLGGSVWVALATSAR
jgi:hypothetical protein